MLCGDFNSTPIDGVYELVTKKNIPVDHKDWQSSKFIQYLIYNY